MALHARHCERPQSSRLDVGLQRKQLLEYHFYPASNQIDQRWPRALERHMNDIDAGSGLEHLSRYVGRGAAAARSEVELSRSCLGQLDQLLQRARGQRRMNDDEERRGDELADRRKRPERLEARIRVEAGRYTEGSSGRKKQRVAVGR